MKRQSLKLYLTAVMAVIFAGCREDFTPDAFYQDRALSFELSMAGQHGAPAAPGTKAVTMKSADGGISLPLEYSVSDGIEVPAFASEPQTKGAQYNTSDELNTAVGTFKVTAWDSGGSKFLPSGSGMESIVSYHSTSGRWTLDGTAPLWKNADHKSFFAYTNLPDGASVTCGSDASHTFTYTTLKTDAADQSDALLGYYKGSGDGDGDGVADGTASIQLVHPLTAVVFKQGELDGVTAIKSISIEGVYDGGEAVVTYSYDTDGSLVPDFDWGISLSTTTTVSQDVPDSGALPGTGEKIGESFIIFPQDLSAVEVTVNATVTTSSGDLILTARLDTGSWESGKTNTYTLGYDANPYQTLTVTGSVLTDYQGVGTKAYSVMSDSPWKLQYTTDGGSSWTDAVANTAIDGWISFDKVSDFGSEDAQTVTATVSAATGDATTYSVDHDAILRSAVPKGSEDAPYDLSMHDIFGNLNPDGKATTANCYVVSSSGWYAFPLVYGNAVKNGELNKPAYFNTGGSLSNFVKADGEAIPENAPYVTGTTKAYPLWEDVPSFALIPEDGCTVLDQTEAALKGLTGCGCDYVMFQVKAETLTQGNAVIAVSDGTDILWSWHIWVTDDDLTCMTVKNKSTNPTFNKGMMPVNLGWVDLGSSKTGYEGRSLQIRFVQMKGSMVKNEVGRTVVRKENATVSAPNGQSPTYQWGRKDPFIRAANLNGNTELSADQRSGTFIDLSNTSTALSESIKSPTQFVGTWDGNSGGGRYNNLWSAQNTATSNSAVGYDESPVKTVYDPCPPGFQVPQVDAFLWFSAANVECELSNGYNFYTQPDKSGGIVFFPASGGRNNRTGELAANSANGDSWFAVPKSANKSYCYTFINTMSDNNRSCGSAVRPVEE